LPFSYSRWHRVQRPAKASLWRISQSLRAASQDVHGAGACAPAGAISHDRSLAKSCAYESSAPRASKSVNRDTTVHCSDAHSLAPQQPRAPAQRHAPGRVRDEAHAPARRCPAADACGAQPRDRNQRCAELRTRPGPHAARRAAGATPGRLPTSSSSSSSSMSAPMSASSAGAPSSGCARPRSTSSACGPPAAPLTCAHSRTLSHTLREVH